MPYVHDITPAASGGSGFPAPFYSGFSEQQLGRVLRTGSANLTGSEATASQYNNSVLPFLFAVDNDRFASFHQNSSQHPTVWASEIGVSTFTLGSASVIRASAIDIPQVKQNPVNPLQFAVLDGGEYVHLSTLDATGTGWTHSSHDLAAVVSTPLFNRKLCDVVWSEDGTHFIVLSRNTSTNRLNISLYTVSGTTLSYVSNTQTVTGTITSGLQFLLAALTGGDDNETGVSLPETGGCFACRLTFNATTVTIGMTLTSGSVGFTIGQAKPMASGLLHNYPEGTAPYANKVMFDFSGSGSITQRASTGSDGGNTFSLTSQAPIGNYMNWDLIKVTSNSRIYPALQGLGISMMGPNDLDNISGEDAMGFCVGHDFTKCLSIHRSGGTFYYRGYTCPTT